MRAKFILILAILVPMLFSCRRGEIDELRERLEAVEKRIDGLDSDIERLNAIVLQITAGGYVTAVVPYGQDADVSGYILSFNDGSSVFINVTRASSPSGVTFVGVDTSDPEYVLITLSDETQLKLPTWAAFDALQQQVRQLNINLAALTRIVSALQDNDYLISTTPFVEDGVPVGWLLNFSKSGLVVIYSSGVSESPQIGVRQDSDGVYYWTLDGEWLLSDDGSKVRAEGPMGADAVPPRLKIEEQYWWISYDDGASWTRLDKAVGEGSEGLFADVDTSDETFVRLVLSDGSTLLVPRYVALDIVFDLGGGPLVISEGEVITVPWTVVGTNSADVTVSALVNGNLSVSVLPEPGGGGVLEITGAGSDPGGSVVVMLSNPSGYSVVRVLTVERRSLVLYDADGTACATHLRRAEFYFYAEPAGGKLSLPYSSNTPFRLSVPGASWCRVVRGWDGPSGTIELELDPNADEASRTAQLMIDYSSPYSKGPENIYTQVFICQHAEGIRMGQGILKAQVESRRYEIDVWSTRKDLGAKVQGSGDWLSASIFQVSPEQWELYVDVGRNLSSVERSAVIEVLGGEAVLGTLLVEQAAQDAEQSRKMILKVLASPANGYTVYLPVAGTGLDCQVDWGDGRGSSLTRSPGGTEDYPPLSHTYYCHEPTEYTVSVSGKVPLLTTGRVAEYVTVVSVEQWGLLEGLESMEGAFRGVSTLRSVAPDALGCFSGVSSFRSAFEGCAALERVPVSLFDAALAATDFERCFYGVGSVTGESPYSVIDGQKVHLYERWQHGRFAVLTSWSDCFTGGSWADQEAICSFTGWAVRNP